MIIIKGLPGKIHIQFSSLYGYNSFVLVDDNPQRFGAGDAGRRHPAGRHRDHRGDGTALARSLHDSGDAGAAGADLAAGCLWQ